MRLHKKYVSNNTDYKVHDNCSFAKQGIHPMFQMMCTIVNHIFLGVCTNKKKMHKNHLRRTLKVNTLQFILAARKDSNLTINNTLEKRLPHGLTYQMIETG